MNTLTVEILAWALVLSLGGIWGITYSLRFFVEAGAKSQLPKLRGRFFIQKKHLTEMGCKLWQLRNTLIFVVGLLWLILWTLKLPLSKV